MPLEHFFQSSALFYIYCLYLILYLAGLVSTFTQLLLASLKFRYPLNIINLNNENRKAEQYGDFELIGIT